MSLSPTGLQCRSHIQDPRLRVKPQNSAHLRESFKRRLHARPPGDPSDVSQLTKAGLLKPSRGYRRHHSLKGAITQHCGRRPEELRLGENALRLPRSWIAKGGHKRNPLGNGSPKRRSHCPLEYAYFRAICFPPLLRGLLAAVGTMDNCIENCSFP